MNTVTITSEDAKWMSLIGLDEYGIKPESVTDLHGELDRIYGWDLLAKRSPILVMREGAIYKASIFVPKLLDEYLEGQVSMTTSYLEASKSAKSIYTFDTTVLNDDRNYPQIESTWVPISSKVTLYPGDLVIHNEGPYKNMVCSMNDPKNIIISQRFLDMVQAAARKFEVVL